MLGLGLEDAENDGKEKQHGNEGSEQIVEMKVRLLLLISSVIDRGNEKLDTKFHYAISHSLLSDNSCER